MKRAIQVLIASAICCLGLFVSCDEETENGLLELDRYNIELNWEDEATTIMVTTDERWAVLDSPDWLSVSPIHGGNGSEEVVITVTENVLPEERKATVTFTNGYITRKLEVTQMGLEVVDAFMRFDDNRLDAFTDEEKLETRLVSNRSWKLKEKPDWVDVSPEEGEGVAVLSVSFDENYNIDRRWGEIVFEYEDKTSHLKVTQMGLKEIIRGPSIDILRLGKTEFDGDLSYCNVNTYSMFVNSAIRDKVFLGNIVSQNIGVGTDIPQFTGYTFNPIKVSQNNSNLSIAPETYIPSLVEQNKYVDKIISAKPKEQKKHYNSDNVQNFYSYRLLHAIGMVNFGIELDKLVNGKSYVDQEMKDEYGVIFSFRHTLFSLTTDLSKASSLIKEDIKRKDKDKGISYVSSVTYGKVGLLVVKSNVYLRKLESAINSFVENRTLTSEETALIESANAAYVYFDNDSRVQVLKGGMDAVEAFKEAANRVSYDNVYPVTFQVTDLVKQSKNEISYSLQFP